MTISAIGHRADGIAETDAGRVFVPYSLVGERIHAIVQNNRGRINEILDVSADRVEPFCPHFQTCGGCTSQHMRDETYRRWKMGLVENALKSRGLNVPVSQLVDAHGRGRRRATFHVQAVKDKIVAGFMAARSHHLLDIDRCPVLAPELEHVTDICRALARAVRPGRKPFAIQVNNTDTGLDCVIGLHNELNADMLLGLSAVAEQHDLARISLEDELVIERRAPIITCGTVRVPVPAGAFLQPTREGEIALADQVTDLIGDAGRVADLFCGIGPFVLRLAKTAQVMAADSDKPSIAALQSAVRNTQGLKPVTAVARDLFRNPFSEHDLNSFDAVVFDPPRAGAMAQVREIARAHVPCVVAVSCDPATFARDAEILVDNGYKLEKVVPVDQFKYTPHVELVALFNRI